MKSGSINKTNTPVLLRFYVTFLEKNGCGLKTKKKGKSMSKYIYNIAVCVYIFINAFCGFLLYKLHNN